MPQTSYTTAEVSKISGFSKRQLDYWATQEVIIPSIQPASGSGTRRLYSFEDLVQLRFIWRLKKHGWSIQKIREAIFRLKKMMDSNNPLHKSVLVHNKKTILAICRTKKDENIILDLLDPHYQQVMWVFVEELQHETKTTVSQLDTVETASSVEQSKVRKVA